MLTVSSGNIAFTVDYQIIFNFFTEINFLSHSQNVENKKIKKTVKKRLSLIIKQAQSNYLSSGMCFA